MIKPKRRILRPDSNLGYVVQWSDTHYPHIDRVAERAVLQFSKDWMPDTHVFIGDCLDLSSISRWSKKAFIEQYTDPVINSFIEFGNALEAIRKINPNSRLIWIWGNHDERLDAFVQEFPAWRGIADDVVGLIKQYGKTDVIDDVEIVRIEDIEDDFTIGKMHYYHGTRSNKHVAAAMVEAYDESITFGHSHTMQSFAKSKRGQFRMGFCIGNMVSRAGRKYTKGSPFSWVTGFAFMEYNKHSGEFTQHLLPIVNGKFRFGGKTYDGNKKG